MMASLCYSTRGQNKALNSRCVPNGMLRHCSMSFCSVKGVSSVFTLNILARSALCLYDALIHLKTLGFGHFMHSTLTALFKTIFKKANDNPVDTCCVIYFNNLKIHHILLNLVVSHYVHLTSVSIVLENVSG